MARIYEPPPDFDQRSWSAGEIDLKSLSRIASGDPARRFKFSRRARYRVDAPGEEIGTLYAALDVNTAFVGPRNDSCVRQSSPATSRYGCCFDKPRRICEYAG